MRIFFCFRNLVYNLSLSDLNQQQKLTWFSNEHDAKMCVMKGKDEVGRRYRNMNLFKHDRNDSELILPLILRLIKYSLDLPACQLFFFIFYLKIH